ncbi:MAG: hypothetical protein RL616_1543, partial [Verrucomicrobiota bacterium]
EGIADAFFSEYGAGETLAPTVVGIFHKDEI